jgi:hypothetical protein
MQAKNKHSILMVLFSLALTGSLLAAKKIDFTEAKVRYTGLTLFQTNEGSGFGGYLEYSLKNADRLVAQLNFVSVSGDDYPLYYYDYYTGQTYYYENADKRRLMFCRCISAIKKYYSPTRLPIISGHISKFLEERSWRSIRPTFPISVKGLKK